MNKLHNKSLFTVAMNCLHKATGGLAEGMVIFTLQSSGFDVVLYQQEKLNLTKQPYSARSALQPDF